MKGTDKCVRLHLHSMYYITLFCTYVCNKVYGILFPVIKCIVGTLIISKAGYLLL